MPPSSSSRGRRLPGIVPRDRIRLLTVRRPPARLIARFLELHDLAGLVSRALDELGVRGAIPAHVIAPIASRQRLVGPAITVRNVPDRFVPYRKWQRAEGSLMGERDAYFVARPGDVIVIDGGGRMDASNMGGHSVRAAQERRCAGAIVDGPVTGVAEMVGLGYPVWARGATTLTGNHRVETMDINAVVSCGGVQVRPGDLVVADDQGIAIVPLEMVEETWRICARRAKVARALATGRSTAHRMRRFMRAVSRKA
ncbi:MAG: RraA family protein [Vicinamibacterales bacterium]